MDWLSQEDFFHLESSQMQFLLIYKKRARAKPTFHRAEESRTNLYLENLFL